MSSIRRNLGLQANLPLTKDKRVEGVAELMLAVRNDFRKTLSEKMLYEWHSMLTNGNTSIQIDHWRTHQEPMQIVSGAIGKEVVHFEALPSNTVPSEMKGFIEWFNESQNTMNLLLFVCKYFFY
ncbi:MAG: hypothetical protein KAJ23_01665 [Maribacter sp.]|nr:hypothetical protein [Maribacter sp.]